jgi:hypothetical protein
LISGKATDLLISFRNFWKEKRCVKKFRRTVFLIAKLSITRCKSRVGFLLHMKKESFFTFPENSIRANISPDGGKVLIAMPEKGILHFPFQLVINWTEIFKKSN